MKLTIGIIAGLGLLFLAGGYFTGRSKNLDAASSAVVPYVLGGALLVIDVVLVVAFGLYRLFFAS